MTPDSDARSAWNALLALGDDLRAAGVTREDIDRALREVRAYLAAPQWEIWPGAMAALEEADDDD